MGDRKLRLIVGAAPLVAALCLTACTQQEAKTPPAEERPADPPTMEPTSPPQEPRPTPPDDTPRPPDDEILPTSPPPPPPPPPLPTCPGDPRCEGKVIQR